MNLLDRTHRDAAARVSLQAKCRQAGDIALSGRCARMNPAEYILDPQGRFPA